MTRALLLTGLLALAACSQAPLSPVENTDLTAQQLSTAEADSVADIAVDRSLGAVYAIGSTRGSLDGPNKGYSDVFIRRYSRSGEVVWKRQMGTDYYDSGQAVTVDRSGNVYAGFVESAPGGSDLSKLEKLRSNGSTVWSRTLQVSTGGGSTTHVTDLSTDADGNVYVVGSWGDVGENLFVRKYSGTGSLLWTRRAEGYGLAYVPSVATDASGQVYVGAYMIDDSFIVSDIRKYSPSGTLIFNKVVADGEQDFRLHELEARGNALYLTGEIYFNWVGNPDEYSASDGLVARFSLSGVEQWRRVFGSPSYDGAQNISTDANGGLYLTGYTLGNLGSVQPRGADAFLRKYSSSGQALWTKQIGSAGNDYGNAVVAYSSSELYLGGVAGGALKDTTHRGGQDGFLRRTDGNGNRVWTDQ